MLFRMSINYPFCTDFPYVDDANVEISAYIWWKIKYWSMNVVIVEVLGKGEYGCNLYTCLSDAAKDFGVNKTTMQF